MDEQIGRLVTRLAPVGDRIAALVDSRPVSATLQVVRYFDHPDGVDDDAWATDREGVQRLPGQHQLLGWHLDLGVVEFLRSVRAALDVDEYDAGDEG